MPKQGSEYSGGDREGEFIASLMASVMGLAWGLEGTSGPLALMLFARGMNMILCAFRSYLSRGISIGLAWGGKQVSKWSCDVIYLKEFNGFRLGREQI